MERSENAISKGRGQISQMALKGLKAFHKKTVEKLANRITVFSALLRKETDPKKRDRLTRWLAEWKEEWRKLESGWKNSRIRSDMAEDYPASTRAMDEVLEVNQRNDESDIERGYREAGRIIKRNKAKLNLC